MSTYEHGMGQGIKATTDTASAEWLPCLPDISAYKQTFIRDTLTRSSEYLHRLYPPRSPRCIYVCATYRLVHRRPARKNVPFNRTDVLSPPAHPSALSPARSGLGLPSVLAECTHHTSLREGWQPRSQSLLNGEFHTTVQEAANGTQIGMTKASFPHVTSLLTQGEASRVNHTCARLYTFSTKPEGPAIPRCSTGVAGAVESSSLLWATFLHRSD